jgi:hypothetical protein
MPDPKVGIPFAFLLALSAATNAGAAALGNTAELLKPGGLRGLLDQEMSVVGDGVSGERSNQVSTRRIAQWFNGSFFSCFQGYWRRC